MIKHSMMCQTQGKMPVTDGRIEKVGGPELHGGCRYYPGRLGRGKTSYFSKGYLNEQNCVLEE